MNLNKVSEKSDFYFGLADIPIFGFHPNPHETYRRIDGSLGGVNTPNTETTDEKGDGKSAGSIAQ